MTFSIREVRMVDDVDPVSGEPCKRFDAEDVGGGSVSMLINLGSKALVVVSDSLQKEGDRVLAYIPNTSHKFLRLRETEARSIAEKIITVSPIRER